MLPIPTSGEEANAYAKAAETAAGAVDKAADATAKAGRFVDQLFGSAISNGLALVGDKLTYLRYERVLMLHDETERRLRNRGIDTSRYIPVNFGLPLIEKAATEEDPDLFARWTVLLANSVDPTYAGKVRRSFVSILADLDPIDAKVLDLIVKIQKTLDAHNSSDPQWVVLEELSHFASVDISEVEISVRNLVRLGVIDPNPWKSDREKQAFRMRRSGWSFTER